MGKKVPFECQQIFENGLNKKKVLYYEEMTF